MPAYANSSSPSTRGSLTAAAAELGLTGSAVGKSISRLEARLGVQLLHRTTRRIDLTNEGEAYLLSCRRIMEELDQTESFLATGHREPIGRLRIDLPTTFGRRHIVPPLLALAARYDRLDLSFTLRDRVHAIWQKTWHLQPKVRVAVDALVSLAENNPDVFDARSPVA